MHRQKCTERARLETNGCILPGAGTPKSEFRLYPSPKSLMEGCLSDRLLRNARINEVPAVAHAKNISLKKGANKNA